MPDFVVRNKKTGKFLHRGGDWSTPLERWKADSVDKARVYRTRGAVTASVGKCHLNKPEKKIRQKCIRCSTPLNASVGKFCPKCGCNNEYDDASEPKRYIPDDIEILEVEIKLKSV